MRDTGAWAEASIDAFGRMLAADRDAATWTDPAGLTLMHLVVTDAVDGAEKLALLLEQPSADPDARKEDGTTPLYAAAMAGNLAAVKLLLARGVDVNNRNGDNRWTVLMVASAEDFPEIVQELLASPAIDVNARAERALTALHVATERGHERVVELLLGHPDVDVNAKDDLGRTPLIIAAFAGEKALVERLLAHPDLEVNAVDRDRQTALAWAALGGDAGVVRALLADPRTNAGITNRPDGRTALEIATAAGNEAAAQELRDRIAADPGEDRLAPGDRYLHLAGPNLIPVSVGMFVRQGARLGPMDDTGSSAFDHLHFSIHDDALGGASVRPNPMDGQPLTNTDDGRCILSSNVPFP